VDKRKDESMSVSVCMAVHNGSSFIKDQVDSILPQLHAQDELVISDDGSSDDTLEILRSYSDERIKILSIQKFGSPVKNFEFALSHCQNDFIFLSDQDDIWHPEKIKSMLQVLSTFDLAVCDCRIVNGELSTIRNSFFELNSSKKGLLKNFFKSSFVGCCMAFRKEVLTKALPFPAGITMHDQWIGLVAQRYFRVNFIPQILVDHRRHGGNYSTTGELSQNSWGKKVISRVKLAKMLLQR